MNQADGIITTSITEGFGLAFLEPYLAGKPLFGRKLPEITGEFEAKKIDLSNLYSNLLIPSNWIDTNKLKSKIRKQLSISFDSYGLTAKDADFEKAFKGAVKDDKIDFGKLDEELQKEAILSALKNRDKLKEIIKSPIKAVDAQDNIIKSNKKNIQSCYSIEKYTEKLLSVYNKILYSTNADNTTSSFSAEKLLSYYIAPERFNLLKT
jgi:glycosyltransferase involved in cell wall biosynthesis